MNKTAMTNLSLPIITQRLIVRDFVLSDIPAVADFIKNPQFAGYRQFRPDHVEADVRTYIQKAIDTQKPEAGQSRELFRLAICLNNPSNNTVIGCCAFDGWHTPSDDNIGYFLDPRYQGHGYTTEAMQGVLDAFWCQYPERPVYATVHPENTASQKVLKKLNFVECGTTTIDVDGGTEPRLKCSAIAPAALRFA